MKKDFITAFSGGKDSVLALYKMIQEGNTPKAIFTIIDETSLDGHWHCFSMDMLKKNFQ